MSNVVFHEKYGRCTVVVETTNSVIIRSLDNSIHECLKSELIVNNRIEDEKSTLRTLLKVQSGLITSINDTWGIFSQTAINLLPHQLWVCNRVMKQWPTRMLVADDVGLGKTIEAGIILLAAITSNRAKRVLILTPAALTLQWQRQMKEKFNLNFSIYTSDADKCNLLFWHTNNFVIASISTLRMDIKDRHEKLLQAPSWDLVLVDEAHHIGRSDKDVTLGYQLVKKLDEMNRIDSIIFFSATPHQGKNTNFWYLMNLLNPVAFSTDKTVEELNKNLHIHMIRNKKTKVIDMNGNYLFKKLNTFPYEFTYSEDESFFYNLLTEYIELGYAYANKQSSDDKRLIGLVLTTIQKIAASSITAIRRALIKRCKKLINENEQNIAKNEIKIDEYGNQYIDDPSEISFYIVQDEIEKLKELIAVAKRVKKESRIEKILDIIETKYPTENILFFTEYKFTQALMVSALRNKYGEDSVVFINGDDELNFGRNKIEKMDRASAMNDFRSGNKRFLVSTDASSEGVDMQEACHILIHIDLPWNPMRMQQRVGRIYRYGQTEDVEVVYVRNLRTVEGNVWEKLNTKIRNIMMTFSTVQGGEPEDLLDMVIGMQDKSFYESLFFKARKENVSIETLDKWFDKETMTFGSEGALKTIKDITGNAQSFDLSFLKEVPSLEIKELEPFTKAMLEYNGSKLKYDGETYSFKTPAIWRNKNRLNINAEYEKIVFSRSAKVAKICAVGSTVFNQAIIQALAFDDNIAYISSDKSYLIVRIFERITSQNSLVKYVLLGYELDSDNSFKKIDDWQLFKILNNVLSKSLFYNDLKGTDKIDNAITNHICSIAKKDYESFGVQFKYPDSEIFAHLIGVN